MPGKRIRGGARSAAQQNALKKAQAASAAKRKANAGGRKASDGLPAGGMSMKAAAKEAGVPISQLRRHAKEAAVIESKPTPRKAPRKANVNSDFKGKKPRTGFKYEAGDPHNPDYTGHEVRSNQRLGSLHSPAGMTFESRKRRGY